MRKTFERELNYLCENIYQDLLEDILQSDCEEPSIPEVILSVIKDLTDKSNFDSIYYFYSEEDEFQLKREEILRYYNIQFRLLEDEEYQEIEQEKIFLINDFNKKVRQNCFQQDHQLFYFQNYFHEYIRNLRRQYQQRKYFLFKRQQEDLDRIDRQEYFVRYGILIN